MLKNGLDPPPKKKQTDETNCGSWSVVSTRGRTRLFFGGDKWNDLVYGPLTDTAVTLHIRSTMRTNVGTQL